MTMKAILKLLKRDPVLLGLSRTYSSVSSFLLGIEISGSAALTGFTEWLAPTLDGPGNLRWERLASEHTLGRERVHEARTRPLTPEEDERAIAGLLELLTRFDDETTQGRLTLQKIYFRYYEWLKAHNSPLL
jgi:hypothetical protein